MIRKTRFLGKVTIASVVLALLVIGIVYAAPAIVDSFDVGEQNLQVTSGSPSASGYVEDGTIMGGERDTFLNYSSGSGSTIDLRIDFEGTSNRLAYTAGDTMKGTAELQWDGDDNGASSLKYGLSRDLSGDDGFLLELLFDDRGGKLTMEAHTDSDHWSDMTINLPGGLDDPTNRMDLVFDHNSFTSRGTAGGVDWTNVNAIVMKLDGTVDPALDVTIDSVESTSVRDYGDLPSGYGTSILNANHIPQGLRLGNNVDTESTYNASTNANGDDTNPTGGVDDEDGVFRTPGVNWSDSTGGSVDIYVEGCGSDNTCYVSGWIDWNNNNSFDDTGEQILADSDVIDGKNTKTFSIPDTANIGEGSEKWVYARFRLCDATGECNTPTAQNVTNGEVEDYYWSFGPNAVTLTRLEATSAPSHQPVGAAAAALALLASSMVVGGVLVLRRRSRLP